MFTKPANEIEFSDVKDFCDEFGEGVRVEYKQEIKNIPKIVSSFANTLGGIFIIGAEADKKTNKVIAIDGIPNSGGLEEQIQQSALTGIYPAVMPEVIILDVPTNPNNVVVIVRVDESSQAPHAIQNSKKVYSRTGSITQPYDYAEIDRIEYMFKRRDDSRVVTRQILDRTEKRIESFFKNRTTMTVTARPVFPYRPIMSTSDIYKFAQQIGLTSSLRVTGGIYLLLENNFPQGRDIDSYCYWEFNEYGIVYYGVALRRERAQGNINRQYLEFAEFVWTIGMLIFRAQSFYKECQYLGNIEVTVQLREVLGEKLEYVLNQSDHQMEKQRSADSEISVSTQYLPQDLVEREKFIEIVDELASSLLWAFNVDDPQGRRELVEDILILNSLLEPRPK